MWCASPGVRPRSASSSTKPDSDGVARCSRRRARPATDGGSRSPYRCAASAFDDDDVGGEPLAVGQHARPPPGRPRPAPRATAAPVPHDGAAQQRPLVHRRTEPAQPAGHVPGAERLLDVRHDRQRGRRPARVGAGVGRVAVEQHPQPRVAQVLLAEPAQRLPRRHRAHVAGPPGQPQQVRGRRPAATRGTAPRVTCQISCARSRKPVPVRRRRRRRGRRRARPAAARARRSGTSSQVTSWPSTAGKR